MGSPLLLAILAVASTMVSAWEGLTSGKRKKATIAAIGVMVAVVTQVLLVQKERQAQEQTRIEQQRNADADVLLKSGLSAIDEASGGAVDGATAYVVDDEEAGVFRLDYAPADDRYTLATIAPQPIVDARRCADRLEPGGRTCTAPLVLSSEHLADLEGAAMANGRLYVITSHGNSGQGREQPRRSVFAELEQHGDEWRVVRATRQLRAILTGYLERGLPGHRDVTAPPWLDPRGTQQVMQAEGLAIDDRGLVYIGLRAPLARGHAILFRAPLESVFAANPRFEAFLLNLRPEGGYGIVSLDFDTASGQLIILGNHWQDVSEPRIWRMATTALPPIVRPTPYSGSFTTVFDAPGTRPAKPEVLLAKDGGQFHVFFDAMGTGGQIAVKVQGNTVARPQAPK